MPKVKANPARELTPETLPEYLVTYLTMKHSADLMMERVAKMKATMMAHLDEYGIENEKGHKVLEIDGVGVITRERRITESFLEEEAERWLKRNKLRDRVIKEVTIEEFDYDEFMGVLQERKVDPAVVDKFYDRNEVFAFKSRAA